LCCAHDFAIKAFEYGNDFDTVGQSRFVVVHPCSSLSLRHLVAPSQNIEFENKVKFVFFWPSRDTIYRYHRRRRRSPVAITDAGGLLSCTTALGVRSVPGQLVSVHDELV